MRGLVVNESAFHFQLQIYRVATDTAVWLFSGKNIFVMQDAHRNSNTHFRRSVLDRQLPDINPSLAASRPLYSNFLEHSAGLLSNSSQSA